MVSLQKGLVGHWTMDDSDTSGGTLYDRSAYDNHGKIENDVSPSNSNIVEQALDFGGSSGYIEIPFSHNKDSISLCGWVNQDTKNNWARLIDVGQNKGNYVFIAPHSSGGKIVAEIQLNNDTKFRTTTNDSLSLNKWHHFAATYDGSTLSLYVNNSNVANISVTDDISNINYSNSTIGQSFYSDPYLDGQVDDIRVYDRALSESKISALYNMRSQRQQNLIANIQYNDSQSIYNSNGHANSKSELDNFFDTSRSDVSNLFATNHDRESINHGAEGQSTSEFGTVNSVPYYFNQINGYSWKLEGEWTATETGTYTFAIDSDDASDVLIDDTAVTTFYGAHSVSGSVDNNSGTINLNAGERYRIAFRYEEGGGGSAFVVGYQKPSDSSYVLFPADEVF